MELVGIYFFASEEVIGYIENWANQFLTFLCVHDVGPFLEYSHVEAPPNDDYEHRMDCNRVESLTQTANPFEKYSIGLGRIVACYWRPRIGSFGQNVVDWVSTHSTIELSPQFSQIGIGPPRTLTLSEKGCPSANRTGNGTRLDYPKLQTVSLISPKSSAKISDLIKKNLSSAKLSFF